MSTPKKIFVIDIEATCWQPKRPWQISDVIEIGVTVVDLKERRIEDSTSILIKPTQSEVSSFCTNLTTITPEMIEENGIPFYEALDILKDDYKVKKNMWASWGLYDYKQLAEQCKREQTSLPLNNLYLNVKALYAWKYGRSVGVGKACQELGIKFEGTPHRGVDDSRMIAEILLKMGV